VGEVDGGHAAAAELAFDGSVRNRYVYGAEGHVPALLLRGDTTYRLITDYLGSVRAVVNTSTGEIVQRRDYDAWGVATLDSNAAFQALGYAGGLADPSTGLVRFGARDYDPSVGRWTAKDPADLVAARGDLYTYAADSPMSLRDENGRWIVQAAGAIVGAIAGGVGAAHQGGSGLAVARGALIGAGVGLISTLPIPGAATLVGSTLLGAGFGMSGNILAAIVNGEPTDVGSISASALAGALGGLAGYGAANVPYPGGGLLLTEELGMPLAAAVVGGIASGAIDVWLHPTEAGKAEPSQSAKKTSSSCRAHGGMVPTWANY
jgi:RHS repeat-associated protein